MTKANQNRKYKNEFHISAKDDKVRTKKHIIEELRKETVMTVTGMGFAIPVLFDIINSMKDERLIRICWIRTKTSKQSGTHSNRSLPKVAVRFIFNIDPVLTKTRNFDRIFRRFFLPELLKSYPNFESTMALEHSSEVPMKVPLEVLRKVDLSGLPDIIREKVESWLVLFEKAQKEKDENPVKTFVDKETVQKYMNKWELLAWITRAVSKVAYVDNEGIEKALDRLLGEQKEEE